MSSIKPYVARLFIYPIKSLDRVECDRVTILESGAVKGDRTWAIFDLNDNFVNGKRNPKIHALRSRFDLETNILTLHLPTGIEVICTEERTESKNYDRAVEILRAKLYSLTLASSKQASRNYSYL